MPSYPRETIEFQPVSISVNGVVVTTGIEYAVTTDGARPLVWNIPTILDGKTGFMVQGQPPGTYTVWARVTANPETVVINCGQYVVT